LIFLQLSKSLCFFDCFDWEPNHREYLKYMLGEVTPSYLQNKYFSLHKSNLLICRLKRH